MENYFVAIIKDATGEVVKRMGPYTLRTAEKTIDGASINLNHKEFSIELQTEPKPISTEAKLP
jgi:hypothetical protein